MGKTRKQHRLEAILRVLDGYEYAADALRNPVLKREVARKVLDALAAFDRGANNTKEVAR